VEWLKVWALSSNPSTAKKKKKKIAKWGGGVAQAVEHLLCKHEALSSDPIPTLKKKDN
jgi:hypothetical protein